MFRNVIHSTLVYKWLHFCFLLVLCDYGSTNNMKLKESCFDKSQATNTTLQNHEYLTLEFASHGRCNKECLRHFSCKSFSYHLTSHTCRLSDSDSETNPNDTLEMEMWTTANLDKTVHV